MQRVSLGGEARVCSQDTGKGLPRMLCGEAQAAALHGLLSLIWYKLVGGVRLTARAGRSLMRWALCRPL